MTAKKKIGGVIVWAIVAVLLIALFVVGVVIAEKWTAPLTGFFGSVGTGGASESAMFVATDSTEEAINATAEAVSRKIIEEGTVLLKNDGALPVAKGSKVSVFGVSSAFWMTGEKIEGKGNSALTSALSDAGLEINTTLRSMYKSSTHKKYGTGSAMGNGSNFSDWNIDEAPWSDYTDDVKASFSQYSDAAFVVLSRGGSEGSDLPMWMDAQNGNKTDSYMSLSDNERELLENVTASFEKVIVILHSSNAMDMDMLNEYDIDSVVWIPGTGDTDLAEFAALITGEKDFSGRTVDTYVYNNMTSNPAVQNFGDFRYVDEAGNLLDYSYVNYAEGIYVGYKYYETRWEDALTGRDSSGAFDYDSVVAYPFGYGLSYNTYAWSEPGFSAPDGDGNITVSVKVTNNGSLTGKDVVELYASTPYVENSGIEVPTVALVGFAKTSALDAGASETVTITVNLKDLASWDSSYEHDGVTGAYKINAGDSYLVLGRNAHDAAKNVLTAKGVVSDGDAALTAVVNSAETYYTVSDNGTAYKNNFSDALLPDAAYLSRDNWSAVDDGSLVYQTGSKDGVSNVMAADGKVYVHTLSAEGKIAIEANGWASSGNPADAGNGASFTTGASNGLSFTDMTGLDYDDPQWDAFLDELTIEDMSSLFAMGGYGTNAIDSVGKPATKEYDGPARILNLFSGSTSYVYPAECMLAATWNTELGEEMGSNIGDECLKEGISGWYAPAMNIHRTAFSGRNFEYYSEDAVLSGKMAAAETKAVQAKGVYAYIKHFALNDQESNRGANGRYAAFATEQAIREIYLEPFRLAVVEGDAHGIMASMNRIGYRWSVAHYGLLTETLRNEWGFKGIVVTDYISSLDAASAEAGIAAGLDLQLITFNNPLSAESLSKPGVQARLREVAHNVIWTQANSLAANSYDFGFPIYRILLIALGVMIALYLAWSGYMVFKYSTAVAEGDKKREIKGADKVISIVLACILAVCLIGLLVWFFIVGLPALRQAFTL